MLVANTEAAVSETVLQLVPHVMLSSSRDDFVSKMNKTMYFVRKEETRLTFSSDNIKAK
jgi:hypothetical protein